MNFWFCFGDFTKGTSSLILIYARWYVTDNPIWNWSAIVVSIVIGRPGKRTSSIDRNQFEIHHRNRHILLALKPIILESKTICLISIPNDIMFLLYSIDYSTSLPTRSIQLTLQLSFIGYRKLIEHSIKHSNLKKDFQFHLIIWWILSVFLYVTK